MLFLLPVLYFFVKKSSDNNISGVNDKYDALFKKYAKEQGVSPKMLKAIAMNESYLGAYMDEEPIGGTTGLMHIKLSTAQMVDPKLTWWSFSDMNPYRDENQIEAAAKLLKRLKGLFPFSEKKIVISYNQGEGHTLKGKDYTKDYYPRYLRNKEKLG